MRESTLFGVTFLAPLDSLEVFGLKNLSTHSFKSL